MGIFQILLDIHITINVLIFVSFLLLIIKYSFSSRSGIIFLHQNYQSITVFCKKKYFVVFCRRLLLFPFINGHVTPSREPVRRKDIIFEYFPVGTILSFSCNRGYKLSGPSTIECGPNGLWTSTPQGCALLVI